MMGAAGAASGPTYVDDVFSTTVYNGTGSSRSVVTGIDNTEKSLLWVKSREPNSRGHAIYDTERGAGYRLSSNDTNDQSSGIEDVTAFNDDGFTTVNTTGFVNGGSETYVAWNFKAAPGFMDIIKWTGTDGSATRVLNHSLDSVPGMVICKSFSNTGTQWYIYHKELGLDKYVSFNTGSANTSTGAWNSVTSTTFGLGTAANLNAAGREHVAYLFADNEPVFGTGGDESIIKCGKVNVGTAVPTAVTLGFEPQWILTKRANTSDNWFLFDNMRGFGGKGASNRTLYPNLNNTEAGYADYYRVTSDGFIIDGSATGALGDVLYMAIRRPNKPPKVATEVFAIGRQGEVNSGSLPSYHSNFVVDMHFTKDVTSSNDNFNGARLLGRKYLKTNDTGAAASRTWYGYDYMDGWGDSTNVNTNFYSWMFKRAPGFFDAVQYSGNDTAGHAISHNLKTTPELMIIKSTTDNEGWPVYHPSYGATKYVRINNDSAVATSNLFWNNTAPTSSVFSVGNYDEVNGANKTYIAYLFATLPGISKVGSYTGTGNDIDVDCGFTAGARFVLIKRTDVGGAWDLMDSVRGIVIGNDKHIALNVTTAQGTTSDFIDPLNAGFTVSAAAPNDINQSGGTYIFLAIA